MSTESPMSIDQAIGQLGREHVREVLRSGKAFDPMAVASFNGRALTAQLHRHARECEAYYVLAACDEPLAWQAIRTVGELQEACLEGSGRALKELRRRGVALPVNAAMQPAWL